EMGAAGLTCSSCEMSAKGNSGMIIHVDRVPIREEGMSPYEIMLSESQERMLIVCEPGRETELQAIFEKWDLHAVDIGEVTDDGRVVILWHGEEVASVPAEHLVLGGGAPVYHRETVRPAYLETTMGFHTDNISDIDVSEAGDVLLKLLAAPNVSSKAWVYEQYDTMVRTGTIEGPGASDAAVVRIKGTDRAVAVKVDCNGRYVYLNPKKGAAIAVAESARNVVCAGGRPLAITNCLNFGNPYKPDVYWTFKEAVAGMGEACRFFNTPVTGGNVSFYNENPEGAVFPTPTIGMLGLVESLEHVTPSSFQRVGDVVILLSPKGWVHGDNIDGSEYLSVIHGLTAGDAPHFDLAEEKAVQQATQGAIRKGLIHSAHDVSDGGLLVCLAEKSIFSRHLGARLSFKDRARRLDAALFGEAQSRIVISVAAEKENEVTSFMDEAGVCATVLGTVQKEIFSLSIGGQTAIDLTVNEMIDSYENTLPRSLGAVEAAEIKTP
ncbi:MAG: AIR synthase-related protein, partial [Rhodothermales bacterium]